MTTTTHWFKYGEPTDNGRVEAELRQIVTTGPTEPTREKITEGTIGIEALEMMDTNEEIREHTHDDLSVMLSGLSDETREEFLSTFEVEAIINK